MGVAAAIAFLVAGRAASAAYPSGPQITDRDAPGQISIVLADWATVPKSGTSATAQVARINFMRAEPVPSLAATRLFANDLNGTLYVVDRATKSFTSYIDFSSIFDGTGGTGVFDNSPGLAAGVVTFQFDPDYASNGKFYTVHTELGGNPTSYREGVLYEWHDTNTANSTFEGTYAQLLKVQYSNSSHPIGDIVFNPLATSDSSDWRNLYIASGDGGAGENTTPAIRNQNQMLNNMLGKVLRLRPAATGTPGAYSIPADNPFAAAPFAPDARGEVYAYGFRNPHRLSWDVNPFDRADNRLLVDDIGLDAWEEVNVVRAGANYGYSRIEGNMVLGTNNAVNNDPLPATLPIYTNTTTSAVGDIVPTYPVAQYSHRDGDAIASGFVYRGTMIPPLRGKYVFGDITTGRLFYCDLSEMLAADDGDPATTAAIHELKVLYASPYDALGLRARRVFDIVRDAFDRRNETAAGSVLHDGTADGDVLPGFAGATVGNDPYGVPYGGGRADVRWVVVDGELYLLSKSDGMIRAASAGDPTGVDPDDGAPGGPDLGMRLAATSPTARDLRVTFTLPGAGAARLEVFDVHGRLVAARDVGAWGPGSHALTLREGSSLPSGVYVVRLTQGGKRLTARTVLVR